MKTRTLLLLSVGTALAILLAGGVLLLQLAGQETEIQTARLGTDVIVGDVTINVRGATEGDDGSLGVDIEVGGTDDQLDSIRVVTGDRSLAPITAAAPGRCTAITVAPQQCRLDFDVSGSATSSRLLVMRRGEEQANWTLSDD